MMRAQLLAKPNSMALSLVLILYLMFVGLLLQDAGVAQGCGNHNCLLCIQPSFIVDNS
jgi:hypothetical protein